MEQASRIFLGLGTNEGDRLWFLRQALGNLCQFLSVDVRVVSSVYETEPVGYADQEWFLNAVIELESMTSPDVLLSVIRDIEKKLLRHRVVRWGPRTIDIDILCFGEQIIERPDLQVPHPRLKERRFVLEPFAEIAPAWRYPGTMHSIKWLLHECQDNHRVRKIAPSSVLWSGVP